MKEKIENTLNKEEGTQLDMTVTTLKTISPMPEVQVQELFRVTKREAIFNCLSSMIRTLIRV